MGEPAYLDTNLLSTEVHVMTASIDILEFEMSPSLQDLDAVSCTSEELVPSVE